MAYVAYTPGLGVAPGEVLDKSKFDDDEWSKLITGGQIVVQGGPDDPKVLAAKASGEGYEDPRDQRIAELEEQLAAAKKSPTNPQQQTPAKQEQQNQSQQSSEDKK
jgi:hypothetical protein